MKPQQLANMIVRAVGSTFSGNSVQAGNIFGNNVQPNILHAQPVGVKSLPADGTDIVALALNGDASRRVAFTINNVDVAVGAGETVIHNGDGSASITIRADGSIDVTATEMRINGLRVAVQGDIDTAGDAIV